MLSVRNEHVFISVTSVQGHGNSPPPPKKKNYTPELCLVAPGALHIFLAKTEQRFTWGRPYSACWRVKL